MQGTGEGQSPKGSVVVKRLRATPLNQSKSTCYFWYFLEGGSTKVHAMAFQDYAIKKRNMYLSEMLTSTTQF